MIRSARSTSRRRLSFILGTSALASSLGISSAAYAQCAPDPTVPNGTTTCDGVDAGRLYVQRRDDELCIVDIALLAKFRGRGIGSLLLSQLEAEADEDHLVVRIHVEHGNPAQRLYLRHGFVFCDEAGGSIYRLMERLPRDRDASRAA